MYKVIGLLAAAALLTGGMTITAAAQTIDKNGKCHAVDGKMAKMSVCEAPKPMAKAPCRDAAGKFIKCSATAAAKPAAGAATAAAAKPAKKNAKTKTTNTTVTKK